MQHITDRFIEFYEYLKADRKVKNASDFTSLIKIGPSMMTELTKGRSKVGIETIQSAVIVFPELNANWLLTGEGCMLLNKTPTNAEAKEGVKNPGATVELSALLTNLDELKESNRIMLAQLEMQGIELLQIKDHTLNIEKAVTAGGGKSNKAPEPQQK